MRSARGASSTNFIGRGMWLGSLGDTHRTKNAPGHGTETECALIKFTSDNLPYGPVVASLPASTGDVVHRDPRTIRPDGGTTQHTYCHFEQ
ncbi:periplasmic serine protease DegS [Anopheles sinensis]|uniref:Periplasmic serine protease DegS n=1 Tax=Anopheles sinensis TaxID=74873 RepID=A0A084VMN0_ANOSI|nr:periplasmic serine protease DegS [Anopheles sinensis]